MKYWGYRIYKVKPEFFYKELKENNCLRQGWGYNDNQNLMKFSSEKEADKRNLPIFNKVKKGDYLFIPKMLDKQRIVVAEATMDFNQGYRFEISNETGETETPDFGHCFPANLIGFFYIQDVHDDLKNSLKCPRRFWQIKKCSKRIMEQIKIIKVEDYCI